MPSGLYFAEGFVISSILFIDVEGICFNNCAAATLVGFPSTKTRTFSFPRRLILPLWLSTLTEGKLFIISLAVAPCVVRSLPIVITFRSTFC